MDNAYTDKYQSTRFLPPLKPLRAFMLVASTESFTKTGECMHLSQSAVSSQIKKLEEYLGVQLFERKPNRLVLTKAGKEYVEPVTQALDMLVAATVDMVEHQKCTDFKLHTPGIFIRWLHPRLGRFEQAFPCIKLHFQQLGDTLFSGDSVDMAIMHQHWDKPQGYLDQVARDYFELALDVKNGCESTDWCLVYRQERAAEYPVSAFREWLLQEVKHSSPLQ